MAEPDRLNDPNGEDVCPRQLNVFLLSRPDLGHLWPIFTSLFEQSCWSATCSYLQGSRRLSRFGSSDGGTVSQYRTRLAILGLSVFFGASMLTACSSGPTPMGETSLHGEDDCYDEGTGTGTGLPCEDSGDGKHEEDWEEELDDCWDGHCDEWEEDDEGAEEDEDDNVEVHEGESEDEAESGGVGEEGGLSDPGDGSSMPRVPGSGEGDNESPGGADSGGTSEGTDSGADNADEEVGDGTDGSLPGGEEDGDGSPVPDPGPGAPPKPDSEDLVAPGGCDGPACDASCTDPDIASPSQSLLRVLPTTFAEPRISPDGTAAVSGGLAPSVWRAGCTITQLPSPSGEALRPLGVSSAGRVIVGFAGDIAGRWTTGGSACGDYAFSPLPLPSDTTVDTARLFIGVDGKVVVGLGYSAALASNVLLHWSETETGFEVTSSPTGADAIEGISAGACTVVTTQGDAGDASVSLWSGMHEGAGEPLIGLLPAPYRTDAVRTLLPQVTVLALSGDGTSLLLRQASVDGQSAIDFSMRIEGEAIPIAWKMSGHGTEASPKLSFDGSVVPGQTTSSSVTEPRLWVEGRDDFAVWVDGRQSGLAQTIAGFAERVVAFSEDANTLLLRITVGNTTTHALVR